MKPQEQDEAPELSRPARALVGGVAVAVVSAVLFHFAMIVLHVAPKNVVSTQYASEIHNYVSPEFVQNWKLFAPEPLHVNVAVHARVELAKPDGSSEVTGWIDIFAEDIEDTQYSLVPSHTRNQLRKGWRTYSNTHDANNQPRNITGLLVAAYLKRVALLRLSTQVRADDVERVQLRSATTRVPEPAWSARKTRTGVTHRELPWWPVDAQDFPEGSTR